VSYGAGFALKTSLPRYLPCLPKLAELPPTGPGWIHEIKHDGLRTLAPELPTACD
jgi:ATP-dependent DNA ligase